MDSKEDVRQFWEDASCREKLLLDGVDKKDYERQSSQRYSLEPIIETFAEFGHFSGKRVLEIGVGLGADHQRFAENGASIFGIDLTKRAVEHTRARMDFFGLDSHVKVGDAEKLEFANDTLDLVYSWGVIHHSPDTGSVVKEIFRLLKPGGCAKIMIYHKWSIVGFMLWFRYGLLAFQPRLGLSEVYSKQLESPGTKAYTVEEGFALFSQFNNVEIKTVLTHADLLTSGAGQRHGGLLLAVARKVWPRAILKLLFNNSGLFMLIEATKK